MVSLLAGTLILAVVLGVRSPHVELGAVAGAPPHAPVALADMPTEEGSDIMRAEFALQDPTPLFLPTEWNSGRVDASMTSEQSPGTSFGSIEPKFVYPTDNNRLEVPDVVKLPTSAIEILDSLDHPIAVAELARQDATVKTLPRRFAALEVQRLRDGKVVLSVEIEEGSSLPGRIVPIELLFMVERAGLVGAPTVIGVAEDTVVDLEVVSEVLKSARLGAVLGPGIYRILLGP
ncbi:hypothetical protein [Synoicihabitans lomoniglobus]|uniref:hypothetical protein n=1 Tax=Synoicihabitans lomoniglobus TaxID=2909285 RepID=UPI002ED68C30|nr:hypothetical protein [Opitutaceae bacterium LMO-M01]